MSFSNFYFIERADVEKAERVFKLCKQIKKDIKNYPFDNLIRYKGKEEGKDIFLFILGDIGILIEWKNNIASGSYRSFNPEQSKGFHGLKHLIRLFILTPELWAKVKTMQNFIKIIHNFIDNSQTLEHEVTHLIDQIDYGHFDKTNKQYDSEDKANREYNKSGIENNARWNEWSTQFIHFLKNKMKSKFKGYLTMGSERFVNDAIAYFNTLKKPMMAEINKNPEKLKKLKTRMYLFHQDLIKKYL